MTCNFDIKNFRVQVSRTLFIREDGSPIMFYTKCGSVSDALGEIIEKGGGILVDDEAEDCIKLCEKRSDPEVNDGFLPLMYINHCVMRNELITEREYREFYLGKISSSGAGTSKSPDEFDMDESDAESSESTTKNSIVIHRGRGVKGRRAHYNMAEDLKIIRYLISHNAYQKTGGNKIWQEMEVLKVTEHSSQSMKCRFQRKILPNITDYGIPPKWIPRLTKKYRPWRPLETTINGDDDDYDHKRDDDDKSEEGAIETVSSEPESPLHSDTDSQTNQQENHVDSTSMSDEIDAPSSPLFKGSGPSEWKLSTSMLRVSPSKHGSTTNVDSNSGVNAISPTTVENSYSDMESDGSLGFGKYLQEASNSKRARLAEEANTTNGNGEAAVDIIFSHSAEKKSQNSENASLSDNLSTMSTSICL